MKNELLNQEIENFKNMIKSCFAYGGIERNQYNFHKWLTPYQLTLGAILFNEIYETEAKELNKYKVLNDVYTDNEGCTYNQLVLK
jgi:hypothetical protein